MDGNDNKHTEAPTIGVRNGMWSTQLKGVGSKDDVAARTVAVSATVVDLSGKTPASTSNPGSLFKEADNAK
uniref:WGS project CBMI000000000 data, contig CS3069_c000197 n=1 Tax=Fusarium clavum TaxID=2594811 RepID=A0A090MAC8_9HYPO|nr:unnamed protein product [Fusarium clavum]